jgi:hypothetical protein
MSGKFSNTTLFTTASTIKDDEHIREIVQNEVFLIFEDIKLELETKIKSIDKNILELRDEVKRIYDHQKLGEFNELLQKL